MELKPKSRIGFGLGAMGKDIVYMFVAGYLLYYYNVVLGISSIYIGTVMMAARVFDAFNDPFMGVVVARTKSRFGRFKPWILAGTVLNALTVYALFAAPQTASEGTLKLWLIVFYLAWGITYTLMDIPFWSMVPAITRPGKERESLSSLARSCSGIGDAIPTVLTMVIVPALSCTDAVTGYHIGFKIWALIIAVFFIISEAVFVLNVPKETNRQEETQSIKEMFQALFRNEQAITIVVSVIFVYAALNIIGNLILYFFQFDVGNTDAYSVFVGVCFAAQVVFMMAFPAFRKKADKNRLFTIGIASQIAGFVLIIIMAYTQLYKSTGWFILCIPGVLVYAGFGILNVLLTIFLSDAVDYGEYKNKKREESVIFSMQTFTVKLASGFAVFAAGIVIDITGLDKDAEVQTVQCLEQFRLWMTIPCIILLIAALIVFKMFYKLDDERMKMISAKLKEK